MDGPGTPDDPAVERMRALVAFGGGPAGAAGAHRGQPRAPARARRGRRWPPPSWRRSPWRWRWCSCRRAARRRRSTRPRSPPGARRRRRRRSTRPTPTPSRGASTEWPSRPGRRRRAGARPASGPTRSRDAARRRSTTTVRRGPPLTYTIVAAPALAWPDGARRAVRRGLRSASCARTGPSSRPGAWPGTSASSRPRRRSPTRRSWPSPRAPASRRPRGPGAGLRRRPGPARLTLAVRVGHASPPGG